MYNVLFISNMFPIEMRNNYHDYRLIQGGENITFIQQSLIEGVDDNREAPCSIINKLLIKKDAKGRRVIKKSEWSHAEGAKDVSFAYLNIPGFSSNLIYYAAKPYIRKAIKNNKNQNLLVIAYGLTNYTLQALSYTKRKSNAMTTLIVPDLPQHTKKQDGSGLTNIKNSITNYITQKYEQKYLKDVDLLLPFSIKMVPALNYSGTYHVFEGICTDSFSMIQPEKLFDKEKTVLYGGGLHGKYGLDILLDAFSLIDDSNIRLVLCGDGSYVSEIKRRVALDQRIVYLGRVPRKRLLSLQLGADVLVNPRSGKQVFSDYSFPSKNMEYLSSGVPFIGFHLGGIPAEYDPYINYPENESPQSLAKKIIEICGEHNSAARKTAFLAREFVLKNKNKDVQAKLILDYASEFFNS